VHRRTSRGRSRATCRQNGHGISGDLARGRRKKRRPRSCPRRSGRLPAAAKVGRFRRVVDSRFSASRSRRSPWGARARCSSIFGDDRHGAEADEVDRARMGPAWGRPWVVGVKALGTGRLTLGQAAARSRPQRPTGSVWPMAPFGESRRGPARMSGSSGRTGRRRRAQTVGRTRGGRRAERIRGSSRTVQWWLEHARPDVVVVERVWAATGGPQQRAQAARNHGLAKHRRETPFMAVAAAPRKVAASTRHAQRSTVEDDSSRSACRISRRKKVAVLAAPIRVLAPPRAARRRRERQRVGKA